MIETIVLNYLKNSLDVPVCTEKPKGEIMEYVLIEKTGSGYEDHIESATLAIQSYSDSLYKAAELNQKVKVAMIGDGQTEYGITAHEDISRCELNSDYNFTDTTTKKHRYQAVYDLVF